MKKALIVIGILLAVAIMFVFARQAKAPSQTNIPVNTPSLPPSSAQNEQVFNKNLYPIDQPDSLWMIVNKERSLPSNYVPGDLIAVENGQLRKNAATEVASLIKDAKTAGYNLKIVSAYRSYSTQKNVYNRYVTADGQTNADTYSARPGHSEHQTGLAVDIGNQNGSCELEICFGDSLGGKWLAANSTKYGFVVRYPNGKSAITGYQYEPWHLRFVGLELAKQLENTNQTLEEFFGVVPTKQPY